MKQQQIYKWSHNRHSNETQQMELLSYSTSVVALIPHQLQYTEYSYPKQQMIQNAATTETAVNLQQMELLSHNRYTHSKDSF